MSQKVTEFIRLNKGLCGWTLGLGVVFAALLLAGDAPADKAPVAGHSAIESTAPQSQKKGLRKLNMVFHETSPRIRKDAPAEREEADLPSGGGDGANSALIYQAAAVPQAQEEPSAPDRRRSRGDKSFGFSGADDESGFAFDEPSWGWLADGVEDTSRTIDDKEGLFFGSGSEDGSGNTRRGYELQDDKNDGLKTPTGGFSSRWAVPEE